VAAIAGVGASYGNLLPTLRPPPPAPGVGALRAPGVGALSAQRGVEAVPEAPGVGAVGYAPGVGAE
jgi:hypothetical protein